MEPVPPQQESKSTLNDTTESSLLDINGKTPLVIDIPATYSELIGEDLEQALMQHYNLDPNYFQIDASDEQAKVWPTGMFANYVVVNCNNGGDRVTECGEYDPGNNILDDLDYDQPFTRTFRYLEDALNFAASCEAENDTQYAVFELQRIDLRTSSYATRLGIAKSLFRSKRIKN